MSKPTNTGTPTASIALAGDAAQLVGVLERLHEGGFDVSELAVGGVSIKLHRAPAAKQTGDDRDAPEGVPAIYPQFGGELLTRALAEQIPGATLQPAIGRRVG